MGQAASSTLKVVDVGPRSPRRPRWRGRTLEEDYVLDGEVLGEGMSGSVKLVASRADGQKSAAKSFQKRGIDEKRLASLRKEVNIYLSLDHPHVARLENVYETDDELHLVMEYMAGGELYERWSSANRRQYTEGRARGVIRQVLLAVAYLHEKNIAHRDLKPQNLMYEAPDSDHLKLIDFGIAQQADANAVMSHPCGTPHYIAPEVLGRCYTNKADLWSVGIIAYMLLTGRTPFDGLQQQQIFCRIKAGRLQWNKGFFSLSETAQGFIQSLLVVNPTDRLSAQQALDHPWICCEGPGCNVALPAYTVSCWQQFAVASSFTRKVLELMAWCLCEEERCHLRQQFLAIDTGKTGTVDLQDFQAAVASSSRIGVEEAEALFATLDSDRSGRIEYSEFLAASLMGKEAIHDKILRRVYARFDADGDGMISEEELRKLLGTPVAVELLSEADADGNGELDFDEFSASFQQLKQEPKQDRPRNQWMCDMGVKWE